MIIKLPYVQPINTLNLPEDFENKVIESFSKFTDGTNSDYTYQDKLCYIDNLKKFYMIRENGNHDVKDLVARIVINNLEGCGEIPEKEEFFSVEFMEKCYESGFLPFLQEYEKRSSSKNDETLKVIFKIIQIVINWERDKN